VVETSLEAHSLIITIDKKADLIAIVYEEAVKPASRDVRIEMIRKIVQLLK
jgi:hypothetical protein